MKTKTKIVALWLVLTPVRSNSKTRQATPDLLRAKQNEKQQFYYYLYLHQFLVTFT
jgi:hypothetical protein